MDLLSSVRNFRMTNMILFLKFILIDKNSKIGTFLERLIVCIELSNQKFNVVLKVYFV